MRTIFRLCLAAAVVAAVGLVAVPAASAKSEPAGHVSITNFEKKQNNKIKKAKKKANKAHNRIENIKAWNFDLDAHNRRQDGALNTVQGALNGILAGVPQIIGALTSLEEGLLALQAALEKDVAPALTALGDGLTNLGAAYQAVEYGAAKRNDHPACWLRRTTSLTPALVSYDTRMTATPPP